MRRVTRRGKTIVSKASRATSTISATPKMTASSLRIIMLTTLDCSMPLTGESWEACASWTNRPHGAVPLCWLHGTSVRENDMLAYHLTYLLAEAYEKQEEYD